MRAVYHRGHGVFVSQIARLPATSLRPSVIQCPFNTALFKDILKAIARNGTKDFAFLGGKSKICVRSPLSAIPCHDWSGGEAGGW